MTLSARDATRFLVLVGLYVVGAWVSVWFIDSPDDVTLIWPPAGIAFAALLLYGVHWWPFIVVGVVLLHLTVAPVPPLFIPFSIASNVLGVVPGVLYVQRRAPHATDKLKMHSGLVLLQGALIIVTISAAIGVAGLVAAGMVPRDAFWPALAKWAMGDLFGLIAITPAVLVSARTLQEDRAAKGIAYPGRAEKGLWLVALLASVAAILTVGKHSAGYALGLSALPMALLMWSALRFEVLLTNLATAGLAIFVATVAGLGLAGFVAPTSLVDTAILLAFMCLIAIVPQMLAAATHESRIATFRLLRRATTDPLTGLANRAAFEDAARALLKSDVPEPMALAYLDLDQFKVVNDTASHVAGDELIRELAGALKLTIGPRDLLARTGGDEFAVLMRDCPAPDAQARARRMADAVADFRFAWQGHVIAPSVSIGVVPFRPGQLDYATLLADADAACFTAKEMGGNQVQLSAPGEMAVHERTAAMRWVVRLSDALQHEHFRLHCQSITSLREADRAGRHFEILLRMHDPETGKTLPPGPFVAAAERFNLGVRLDRYVVEHTLRWLEQHPAAAQQVELCSINLTASSATDESFLRFLQQRLAASTVPPSKLCFELTETGAVRDIARAQRFIAAVRGLGCRFALDDFGSGFCSFAYLKSLDVDFFKIDGGFVREVHQSPLALAIVRSIAEIARVMRKHTIAEYAESETIRRHLQALGVDYAQGFAIDEPVPIDDYFARPAPSVDDVRQAS
jgi:diguanylate cyclase (GGDEF)-like protein